MDTNENCVIFGLITSGIIILGLGLWTRLGKNRAWYLVPNYYVLLPKGGHYAMPIIGLMTIALGVSLLMPGPELTRKVISVMAFPLAALAFLIVVFQPRWFKPKWVLWLEENHSDILEILIEEGRETTNWGKRVSTQEGLESWVEEIRRKYRL